jgi:hypothetical protein
MKTKLTLSVDADTVRQAKALSKRLGKSVSELFEEAVERAGGTVPHRGDWKELLGGTLELSDADAQRQDRVGRITRRAKAVPTRRKAKRA